MNGLEKAYFEWLCDKVSGLKPAVNASYSKLLLYLYQRDFYYSIAMDDNRYADGVDLRYLFGYECGVCDRTISLEIDVKPCSILEMMIALAYRIEQSIMIDSEIGDRTGKWFWEMVLNLGLGQMTDAHFDERRVSDICDRFLDRKYEANGKGGLFSLHHRNEDMRDIDIWYQAMWYLAENYE